MIFSFFRKKGKDHKHIQAAAKDAMRPAAVRVTLLFLLWAGIMAAFWYRFEYTMLTIQAKSALYDPQNLLSDSDKRELAAQSIFFKKELNTKLMVQVVEKDIHLPPLDTQSLFMAVSTDQKQSLIQVSGLAAKVLKSSDYDQRLILEEELARCLGQNSPGTCLLQSLDKLAKILLL